MKKKLLITLFTGLSVSVVASASVTWDFANATGQVANGTAFAGSGGGGNIVVYAEQVSYTEGSPNLGVIQSPVQTLGGFNSLSGLFQVSNANNAPGSGSTSSGHGAGLAPFNAGEVNGHTITGAAGICQGTINGGTTGFDCQDGITDFAQQNSSANQFSNILELNISGVQTGTVLKFLLQGPPNDPTSGETTSVNVYTANASTPQNLSAMTVFSNSDTSPISGPSGITTTGLVSQFTITKTTANEFVAIQADCHYLLLNSITGTPPSGVPEPSFYGFFGVAMVGLVIGARKLRARAAAVAVDQA